MTELHKDALEICKAFALLGECVADEVRPYLVRQ